MRERFAGAHAVLAVPLAIAVLASSSARPVSGLKQFGREQQDDRLFRAVAEERLEERVNNGLDMPLDFPNAPHFTVMEAVRMDNSTAKMSSVSPASINLMRYTEAASANVEMAACGTTSAEKLRYSECGAMSIVGDGSGVNVGVWLGRVGNNLLQLTISILFAEATGRRWVGLPTQKNASIHSLLQLPEDKLAVQPNLALQMRVRCSFYKSGPVQGLLDYMSCSGAERRDYRRVMRQYIKPLFNPTMLQACGIEAEKAYEGLTIHLRSGDLLDSDHPQSRFLPCSFYDQLIESHGFEDIRIITEPDMAHPCIGTIQERHPDKVVEVQSNTVQEDFCALMSGKHLAYGLTTFAETAALLNKHVERIFAPSLEYMGAYRSHVTGLGMKACSDTKNVRSAYFMYKVKGMEVQRATLDKNMFLLGTPPEDISLIGSCTPV